MADVYRNGNVRSVFVYVLLTTVSSIPATWKLLVNIVAIFVLNLIPMKRKVFLVIKLIAYVRLRNSILYTLAKESK